MEDPMIETFMDKIKSSALKSMKRIGDQSRRFQEIVYGKSLETFICIPRQTRLRTK
jgi:hypothetical protein